MGILWIMYSLNDVTELRKKRFTPKLGKKNEFSKIKFCLEISKELFLLTVWKVMIQIWKKESSKKSRFEMKTFEFLTNEYFGTLRIV